MLMAGVVPLTPSCERLFNHTHTPCSLEAHSANDTHSFGCLMSVTFAKGLWWCYLSIALVIAFIMFRSTLSEVVKMCRTAPKCDLVENV